MDDQRLEEMIQLGAEILELRDQIQVKHMRLELLANNGHHRRRAKVVELEPTKGKRGRALRTDTSAHRLRAWLVAHEGKDVRAPAVAKLYGGDTMKARNGLRDVEGSKSLPGFRRVSRGVYRYTRPS